MHRSDKGYVLDTSVLIQVAREQYVGRWIQQHYDLFGSDSRYAISYINRAEALAFIKRRNWGGRRENKMNEVLNGFPEISIESPEVFASYLECDAHLQSVGVSAKAFGYHDLWIAATALSTDATLLSTDKGFRQLQDLIEFEYIDQRAIPKDWQPPGS